MKRMPNLMLEVQIPTANTGRVCVLGRMVIFVSLLSACASPDYIHRDHDHELTVFYHPDKTCNIFMDGKEVDAHKQGHYGTDETDASTYWHCTKPNVGDARVQVTIWAGVNRARFNKGEEITSGVNVDLGGAWLFKYETRIRPLHPTKSGLKIYQYKFQRYDSGEYSAKLIGAAERYRSTLR